MPAILDTADDGALTHTYVPQGSAARLMEDRRAEVLLSGPAGTGKSRACLEKLHMLALLNPGMRGLIVRKTGVSLTSTALVTWQEHVATEAIEAGDVTWYGGSQREAAQYRYSNGSRVMVGGMDKPTKVMSSEYDVIYVQEAIELTETDWESLISRLRNGRISFQQLIADTNPDTPTHWLKVRSDRGQTAMYESRHEENPVYFREDGTTTERGADYMALLDSLTGVRYHRLRRGLWVAAEGVIYEEWDPAVHLVDRRRLPNDWPRYWVVDFGYTNPFVLQRWAQDPDGRLWLYAERYHTKQIVEDHARAVLAEVTDDDGHWREPQPRAIICDHDAEDRATLERHLRRTTTPARKSVSDGIQFVQSRLRPAGDGKPRLFVMRDARHLLDPDLASAKKPTCTAEEVPGYIWQPSLDGRANKDAPLKLDDHGMDAMRYMVAQLDSGPQGPARGKSPANRRTARGADLARRSGSRVTR